MRKLSIALLVVGIAGVPAFAQTAAEQRAILRGFESAVWLYAEQFDETGEQLPRVVPSEAAFFTEPVCIVFRQLIATGLGEPPVPAVSGPRQPLVRRLEVGGPFPLADSTPLGDALIAVLPVLPTGLEYRLVGNDLVLRDTHLNIVVGILSDAVRRSTRMTQDK